MDKSALLKTFVHPNLGGEDMAKQLALHATLLSFSRRCLQQSPQRCLDESLVRMLGDLCDVIDADRGYLYMIDAELGVLGRYRYWTAEGHPPPDPVFDNPDPSWPSWLFGRLRRLETVMVDDPAHLPRGAVLDRALLEQHLIGAVILVPLHARGHLRGILGVDRREAGRRWAVEDSPAVELLANTLELVFERLDVEEELNRSRQQLKELSARHVKIREEEQARIAREIHDELGQCLTAIRLEAGLLQMSHGHNDDEILRMTEGIKEMADVSINVVRDLATALRPPVLNIGLPAACEWLMSRFAQRYGMECHAHIGDAGLILDDEHSTALFRILQEAMTNVARHARATRVEMRLGRQDGGVILEVIDDGIGFEPDKDCPHHPFGLLGMEERAMILGGELTIFSRKGRGTAIQVWLPMSEPKTKGTIDDTGTGGG